MRRHTLAAAFAAPLALSCGGALAFDCGAARSKTEKALCADPAAKASDDAMSAAFAALRPQLDAAQSQALLANQRAWLKNRESSCGSMDAKAAPACLKGENEARVAALTAKPAAGPGVPGRLVPVFIARPGSKRSFAVDWLLYRFQPAVSPAELAFNKAVHAMIAEAPTECEEPPGGGRCSSDRKSQVTYASDRLLSVAVTGYEFAGGAHGSETATTLNLDLKGGRLFSDDDLLPASKRADLAKLCAGQVGADLKSKLKDSGEDPDKDAESRASFAETLGGMSSGIADTVKGIANWSFGPTGATITFVQDSIAPHVYGGFSCEIPYATLRGWAKPGFTVP